MKPAQHLAIPLVAASLTSRPRYRIKSRPTQTRAWHAACNIFAHGNGAARSTSKSVN
jgi:hypothetical protein